MKIRLAWTTELRKVLGTVFVGMAGTVFTFVVVESHIDQTKYVSTLEYVVYSVLSFVLFVIGSIFLASIEEESSALKNFRNIKYVGIPPTLNVRIQEGKDSESEISSLSTSHHPNSKKKSKKKGNRRN